MSNRLKRDFSLRALRVFVVESLSVLPFWLRLCRAGKSVDCLRVCPTLPSVSIVVGAYNVRMSESSTDRIVDANFNRAREGLRVVEEFARFGWDDPVLCGEAKRLRHGLLAAIGTEAVRANVLSRDTGGDVGTEVSTEAMGEAVTAELDKLAA